MSEVNTVGDAMHALERANKSGHQAVLDSLAKTEFSLLNEDQKQDYGINDQKQVFVRRSQFGTSIIICTEKEENKNDTQRVISIIRHCSLADFNMNSGEGLGQQADTALLIQEIYSDVRYYLKQISSPNDQPYLESEIEKLVKNRDALSGTDVYTMTRMDASVIDPKGLTLCLEECVSMFMESQATRAAH